MKNKVTKLTKLDKLDNYGNTTFVVEFADGVKGFYTSKDPEQKKFVVGTESVEFNIEEKEGKKGKYNKITLPQMAGKPPFGGGKPPVEPRVQMISFAAAYTKDLIVAGKVPLSEFGVTFEMIYGEMTNKI
jgi:hypothetical protein